NRGGTRHADPAHGTENGRAAHTGYSQTTGQAVQPQIEQLIQLAANTGAGNDLTHQNEQRNGDQGIAGHASVQSGGNDVQAAQAGFHQNAGNTGDTQCGKNGGADNHQDGKAGHHQAENEHGIHVRTP